MAKLGGTKAWVAATGVALLVAFVVVPALSGAASAAPAPSANSAAADPQWAYGGEGWSNGTLTVGNATLTWNAMFGWTVIWTATELPSDVILLEEQRTVGVQITATLTTPVRTVHYSFDAQEVDTAFANLTNQSVVYVAGSPVAALGVLNASASVSAAIQESISETVGLKSASASLDISGSAQAAVSFSPSLGLIPLNLTGVDEWNSSAVATPSASWNLGWNWKYTELNGTSGSGSNSAGGSLSATAPVNVTGYKVAVVHPFSDHKVRIGILLVVQGPFDVYDGFLFVPHGFDLFGGAAQGFDSLSLGSASISHEDLYLTPGPGGYAVTAADTTFGADDSAVDAASASVPAAAPAATASDPGTTVQGQPMTVAQAQAEDQTLTHPGSAGPAGSGIGLIAAVAVGLIAVVVGTVGVIEWRSYARRRSQKQLVGGYGESWTNGVPPAGSLPPVAQGPTGPTNGTGPADDPSRRL